MEQIKRYFYEQNGIRTRISLLGDGIIRVTRTRRDLFSEAIGAAAVPQGEIEGTLKHKADEDIIETSRLTVRISHSTGAIAFENAIGQSLLREPDKRPCQLAEGPVYVGAFDDNTVVTDSESVDGMRADADPVGMRLDRTAYEARQGFVFDDDEGLYGLGSHEEGYGNLRGHARTLYQHNMKAVVPVLVSTKGWGILFDMGCMMAFHDDEEGSYLWAECVDELDWYFLYGDGTYAGLMGEYRKLTGPSPMLPKYALGYIQSKERYKDAEELIAIADEYRLRRIPLDMVVLDWQSWPDGQWGWKRFDPTRFPDPAAMIRSLHARHVKFMISIWPSLQGEKNKNRHEMLEKGFMLGNRLIYDAFNPDARALYWKHANEGLFRYGVDAWWCDCSEPFESDWHGAIKPEPFERVRMNTEESRRYLDPSKINLYSLYHSQGIYEGQRGTESGKRVCNLTRSAYAGQHRYATVTWSGDVCATWETLRRHVPEGLNFCAAGEPWWSTDIGAFFPNRLPGLWFWNGDFDGGVDDLGYRELYVRWAQYAAFLPMMRSHGTGTPREIWRFGEAGEPFYEAIADAIRLRYRLLPYLYSLAAQASQAGVPMLRVPALVFPEDPALRSIGDEMMLGDDLLVKPVTHPMYYLPKSKRIEIQDFRETVYLPAGHDWYDLNTGEKYEGGQSVTVQAPLNTIPMFVRAGAILPWGSDIQHTGETAEWMAVRVFPGRNGRFTLYDDAGDGYDYERGLFCTIECIWDDCSKTLRLGPRHGLWPGMADTLRLRLYLLDRLCHEAVYDGNPLEVVLAET